MIQVGGHYPLHTAVSCLTPSSVEIVRALLEHGADPNCEEGLPAKKQSHTSITEGEGAEEEKELGEDKSNKERLNKSKDRGVAESRVTFHIAAEGGGEPGAGVEEEVGGEVDAVVANGNEDKKQEEVPVVHVLAGENEGGSSYTPLHLVCSTDTSNSALTHSATTSQQEVCQRGVASLCG